MITVKKVSQRGLLAAAIMLALILVFYSLGHAQAPIVNIPCDQDIDATINAADRGTASRFVLEAGCTFVASETIELLRTPCMRTSENAQKAKF